jgi:hypothetical protein
MQAVSYIILTLNSVWQQPAGDCITEHNSVGVFGLVMTSAIHTEQKYSGQRYNLGISLETSLCVICTKHMRVGQKCDIL